MISLAFLGIKYKNQTNLIYEKYLLKIFLVYHNQILLALKYLFIN